MIYNLLCAGRYDNYIQLFTTGRHRDNIVNRDKLKTNYRDKKYSLSPKPNAHLQTKIDAMHLKLYGPYTVLIAINIKIK